MVGAGVDPLLWRLALHPRIPMTITEADAAPVRLVWEADAWADALDHQDEQAAIDREADDAIRRAANARGWR